MAIPVPPPCLASICDVGNTLRRMTGRAFHARAASLRSTLRNARTGALSGEPGRDPAEPRRRGRAAVERAGNQRGVPQGEQRQEKEGQQHWRARLHNRRPAIWQADWVAGTKVTHWSDNKVFGFKQSGDIKNARAHPSELARAKFSQRRNSNVPGLILRIYRFYMSFFIRRDIKVNVHAACQPRARRCRHHAVKSKHEDLRQFGVVAKSRQQSDQPVMRYPVPAVASTLRQPSILDARNQSAAPVNHAGTKPAT